MSAPSPKKQKSKSRNRTKQAKTPEISARKLPRLDGSPLVLNLSVYGRDDADEIRMLQGPDGEYFTYGLCNGINPLINLSKCLFNLDKIPHWLDRLAIEEAGELILRGHTISDSDLSDFAVKLHIDPTVFIEETNQFVEIRKAEWDREEADQET